jgi:hypothetical protein
MPQSENIGDLAKALAATQAEMTAPKKAHVGKIKGTTKDGRSYEYEYRYADLADVIECRKVGAKHGLAITQGMETKEGYFALTTMLMHSSGQWKAWDCPIPGGLSPQQLGSFLTYMRRYSESGAWGIAAEDDDDGKAAEGNGKTEKPAPKPAPEPKAEPRPAPETTPEERVAISAVAKQKGIRTQDEFSSFLSKLCPVARTTSELSRGEYVAVWDALRAMPDAKKASAA